MKLTKWDYKQVPMWHNTPIANERILKRLGNEGWELTSVEKDTGYFKRPRKDKCMNTV